MAQSKSYAYMRGTQDISDIARDNAARDCIQQLLQSGRVTNMCLFGGNMGGWG